MTCKDAKEYIEKKYNVKIGSEKKNDNLLYRYNYYYLCDKYADDAFSFISIGKPINKGYHSVYYGLGKFADFCDTDKKFLKHSTIIRNEFIERFNYSEEKYTLVVAPVKEIELNQRINRLKRRVEKLKKQLKEKTVKRTKQSYKKKVYQYDLKNNFIQEFNSIKEASVFLGFDRKYISYNCNGKQKTCKGFIFKFTKP